MDKRSGFWQEVLTPNAQERVAFITPQGRVFKWKVTPLGAANAPALFPELIDHSCPSYVVDPWCKNSYPEAPRWKHIFMMYARDRTPRRTT